MSVATHECTTQQTLGTAGRIKGHIEVTPDVNRPGLQDRESRPNRS